MNKQPGIAAIVIGVFTATIPTTLLFLAVTYLFLVPFVLGIVCIGLGVVAIDSEGKLFRYVGWLSVGIMLVAVVLPFGVIAYHRQSGYPIVLVIPEGYRGPVRLVVDEEDGVDVPLEKGKFTYHIPQSGTLRIKDDSPFRRWHPETAMYTNGRPIPIDYNETLAADTVSLHSFGSGAEGTVEYFVGTKIELQDYFERWLASPTR